MGGLNDNHLVKINVVTLSYITNCDAVALLVI